MQTEKKDWWNMYKVFQIIDCDANMKEEGLHFSLSFSLFCVPVCEFQDLF